MRLGWPETPAEILRAVKRAIRDKYAWPGGYPLFVIMADGESLSVESARSEWRSICHSTLTRSRDGWAVAGVGVNWEDDSMHCAHSGARIESAYGDNEEEESAS